MPSFGSFRDIFMCPLNSPCIHCPRSPAVFISLLECDGWVQAVCSETSHKNVHDRCVLEKSLPMAPLQFSFHCTVYTWTHSITGLAHLKPVSSFTHSCRSTCMTCLLLWRTKGDILNDAVGEDYSFPCSYNEGRLSLSCFKRTQNTMKVW